MTLPVFLTEDGLVTDAQVRRLREKRMAGKTLAAAAAAAGMSERAARKWQSGALPSAAKAPRSWRTREDPFADVWQSEVVPQLVADTDGRLQVLTLFKALCRRHPGRFQPGQLRTLQRRVREWRVQYGPDSEVYFEQVAVPGREAAFDFTDASDLGVTLGGVRFPHVRLPRLDPRRAQPRSGPALRGSAEHRIDYRHIIGSLVVRHIKIFG